MGQRIVGEVWAAVMIGLVVAAFVALYADNF